ncbi:MAG TPA: pyridoxamine 5'-phosphate oxidase family protein [Clostridia bacterium]|nr:pyridoxamine 5'-phosphate oxidase family protein [Clostridia bacterium]
MRRKDREQSREFALKAVDECEYVALATINEDGSPYCVPMTIVHENDSIYFHAAKEGKKLENIRRNPAVSLACVSKNRTIEKEFTVAYESAIVEGTAAEVVSPDEKARILYLLCVRHSPSALENAKAAIEKELANLSVIEIKIKSISGKANIRD